MQLKVGRLLILGWFNKTCYNLINMKLNCIKCAEQYESNDPDPYYCSPCETEKKALAKKIDAEIATRPRESKKLTGQEAELDRWKKEGGFMPMLR